MTLDTTSPVELLALRTALDIAHAQEDAALRAEIAEHRFVLAFYAARADGAKRDIEKPALGQKGAP